MPVTDEQAKAVAAAADFGKAATEVVRSGGSYVGRVLGSFPEDLVGWLIGDQLHVARWERAQQAVHDARERLQNRGVQPQPMSPALAAPLLDGAASETEPTLAELWTRLLANALDPNRKSRVRRKFIDVIKNIDPLDARVFQVLASESASMQPSLSQVLASRLQAGPDDVEVSLDNLHDQGLIVPAQHGAAGGTMRLVYRDTAPLTPFGRQFARAVDP